MGMAIVATPLGNLPLGQNGKIFQQLQAKAQARLKVAQEVEEEAARKAGVDFSGRLSTQSFTIYVHNVHNVHGEKYFQNIFVFFLR